MERSPGLNLSSGLWMRVSLHCSCLHPLKSLRGALCDGVRDPEPASSVLFPEDLGLEQPGCPQADAGLGAGPPSAICPPTHSHKHPGPWASRLLNT